MNVTRDREKGSITITQKYYTEDVVHPYGIATPCTPLE